MTGKIRKTAVKNQLQQLYKKGLKLTNEAEEELQA